MAIRVQFKKTNAVLTPFDELNIIGETKKLFTNIENEIVNIFTEIYKDNYLDVRGVAPKSSKSSVEKFLKDYNFITGYIFFNELDRKRSRLAESIISKNTKMKELVTTYKLLWRQVEEYGVEITDNAVVQAYKDLGYEKVKWHTEEDDRVCKICKSRDGKIYPIDKIPNKPHIGCRCWVTGVKGED